MSTGTVREWWDAEGWGVIDCDETPGGCWAHFSQVKVAGYRAIPVGSAVRLDWEPADTHGFAFRATAVWPQGADPVESDADGGPSSAMSSSLIIEFDDDGVP